MNDFITGDIMATYVGLVAAVALIVQFTKGIFKKKFGDASVRLYTFAVSLILTFLFVSSGTGIRGIVLTIINAILVSMAAMGSYEVITDPKARKTKPKDKF